MSLCCCYAYFAITEKMRFGYYSVFSPRLYFYTFQYLGIHWENCLLATWEDMAEINLVSTFT